MARIFIHRPVLAIVISLVLLIAGGVAIPSLPISQYPDITPPTVEVTATYTGANAQTVAETVAAPIEQQVNGVENMIYMQSKSTNDGRCLLTVTFEVGTDPSKAEVDVQNRVNRANSSLPPQVVQSGVTVKKKSTQILLFVTLSSPDGTVDGLFLSNYATINIIDELSRIPGVSDALITAGKRDYSLRAWVRPDKLSRLGVTAGDLNAVIGEQNSQAAAGQIGQPPVDQNLDFQYAVDVKGRLNTEKDFGNIIVRTNADGSILRLRDVARIEMGAQDYNSFGRLSGKTTVPIAIFQSPGANAIELAKKIRARMEILSKSFPEGMKYEVSFDSTLFVTASIEEVIQTLFEAVVLVVLVVFIFLGNFRATLIPMLAVPVSLIATFAAFSVMGFSINMLTLFGIVLAVGIVVDDAIVVVEAVEHHIEHGLGPIEATEKAMEEVSGPVVAIALVLSAVFIPVAFIGGITGLLYRQFAVTLAASVCLSALVALTLTPALCALMLRPRKPMWGPVGWFLAAFNKVFDIFTNAYTAVVRVLIRMAPLMILALLGFFGGTYLLLQALPTAFLPDEDNGYFIINITLPDGASLARSDAVLKEVETITQNTEGVKSTVALGGFGVIDNTYQSNYASIYVVLKPWEERKTHELQASSLIRKLQARFKEMPQAIIGVFNPPAIPGLGATSGFVCELQDRAGVTEEQFQGVVDTCTGEALQGKDIAMMLSSYRVSVPRVHLEVDRDKVKTLGIPLTDVFTSLQTYLGGYYVNQFNKFGRTWRVYVQAEPDYRVTPDDIGGIFVRSSQSGQSSMVPLKTLVTSTRTSGPDTVLRYNLYRTAELTGVPARGVSSGQAMKAMDEVAKKLPAGTGLEWTGTAYQEKKSAGTQGPIFALAILFVFLFLAALYESWAVPFAVLLAIPLGVFGAFGAVWLRGLPSDVYVQVGLVMLIGLAAKNAILIVEFAKAEHEKGVALVESAVTAARMRLRPILMTSFAFILGVVPLLTAEGAGAASRVSLGTAVFGGMLAATAFGIFFVPVLYVLVQGFVEMLFGNRTAAPVPVPESEAHATQA